MKIPKLKCDKLAQTPAAAAGKAFVTACRNIASLHNSPAIPTGYLFITEQSLKNEKSPCALLVIGDLTAAWLKFARALKKTTPKGVIFGQCFAQQDGETIRISLINKVGGAKLNTLLKDSMVKALLKKAKTEIGWGAGMSDDAEESIESEILVQDELNAEMLDDEENDSVEDYLEEDNGGTNEAWENYAEDAQYIKNLLEEIGKTKKEDLKTKHKKELVVLIPKFLAEIDQVKGIPPPKLFDFKTGLAALWARWQKQTTISNATPEQEAIELVKKAFRLFKALKDN